MSSSNDAWKDYRHDFPEGMNTSEMKAGDLYELEWKKSRKGKKLDTAIKFTNLESGEVECTEHGMKAVKAGFYLKKILGNKGEVETYKFAIKVIKNDSGVKYAFNENDIGVYITPLYTDADVVKDCQCAVSTPASTNPPFTGKKKKVIKAKREIKPHLKAQLKSELKSSNARNVKTNK
jgi:hypothetical protein